MEAHTPAGWSRRMVPLAVAVLAAVALHVAAPAGAQENDASPGLSGPADGAEPKTSLSDIEDELSQSPQAERERAFIQDLIGQGATKDEVKDALVAEYGPEVLATPDTEGFDLAAWLVPAAAILLAAVAIFLGLRRWRRDRTAPREEGAAIDPADRERLDEDIARYDL